MIGVGRSKIRRAAITNTRPVRTAVDRAQNTVSARLSSRIDDGRICGIDD